MDIKYPRRILAIGNADSGVLQIITDLAGSLPPLNDDGSTAGLSHEWDTKTTYYSAKIPIWIDEISDVDSWRAEFLKDEAAEVVEAVGAWIFCFRYDTAARGIGKEAEDVMKAIQEVYEKHVGMSGNVVMLAVAVPRTTVAGVIDREQCEQSEDVCLECGFEFIDYQGSGMNEFGEKMGFERMKEALEANEWESTGAGAAALLGNQEDNDLALTGQFSSGIEVDEAEWTTELFGIKAALAHKEGEENFSEDYQPSAGQQEIQVDDLDKLMGKLLSAKEHSAELPEATRKRLAAQAVRDLMGGI